MMTTHQLVWFPDLYGWGKRSEGMSLSLCPRPLPLSPHPYRKGLGTKLLISCITIRPFLSVKDVACETIVNHGNATSLVDSQAPHTASSLHSHDLISNTFNRCFRGRMLGVAKITQHPPPQNYIACIANPVLTSGNLCLMEMLCRLSKWMNFHLWVRGEGT